MRIFAVALALMFAAPAHAALPVGTLAPDFATQGALAGKPFAFSLSKALKKGPVVLYFFPAAFTPGCTIEAHLFAEAAAEFKKTGATLIGVAADPIDRLTRFSVEECRSAFPVAVATPAMISAFDVKLPQLSTRSNRTSYVIARTGRIIFSYSDPDPQKHVSGTLAAARAVHEKP